MKPVSERLLHAILFESCALLIMVPLAATVLQQSMHHIGVLGILLCGCAMLWNMLFNAVFERLEARYALKRTLWLRASHAVAFEGGLVLLAVPLAAWWMAMSLWQAFLLDLAFLLLFLPYTMLFNWLYDLVRARLLASKVGRQAETI